MRGQCMCEMIMDREKLKQFMKVIKFNRLINFASRKEVAEKVKEIAIAYHNEITPIKSDESNDYKIEIDFLDYCYSFKNDIDWNPILISTVVLNFERSLVETFNIEKKLIENIMAGYNEAFDDRYNYLIDSICYAKNKSHEINVL